MKKDRVKTANKKSTVYTKNSLHYNSKEIEKYKFPVLSVYLIGTGMLSIVERKRSIGASFQVSHQCFLKLCIFRSVTMNVEFVLFFPPSSFPT